MQEVIRSRKNPEAEEAGGTRQLLKEEKPRGEGAETYKGQEKPREEGTGSYKEQEKPRSGSNSKNHKNIKNKSI